ncbi:MAG: response regulator [Rhodospirillaceae bacterium]|nr:response regulator [Rhodospirillaceae bacterium]
MSARILIAEDEPNIVESLSYILEQADCTVSVAMDGDEAVAQLMVPPPPDVLILDLMLPKRSGFDILKWMKGRNGLERVRVLMLTAKGQQHDRKTAEGLGADAFIAKPFANRDVVDCVKRLIAD